MEQQFYQVASDMQTVQDEGKQYNGVKCDSVKEEMKEYCAHALQELVRIIEERCAHAKEKHRKSPVRTIHFKEEASRSLELAPPFCALLHLSAVRGTVDAVSRHSFPEDASHKWRKPAEYDLPGPIQVVGRRPRVKRQGAGAALIVHSMKSVQGRAHSGIPMSATLPVRRGRPVQLV
ncbi:hypothetical protein E2C01_067202 [Portunus trituberculatus]|uniref:Uncharacterized protein n=1 Tax=Portunus trituberculatus TaxID=210409 RepID=A0A5B7HSZ3_PORTR|nr:hypothetical protein [Portunus trituberculatus]